MKLVRWAKGSLNNHNLKQAMEGRNFEYYGNVDDVTFEYSKSPYTFTTECKVSSTGTISPIFEVPSKDGTVTYSSGYLKYFHNLKDATVKITLTVVSTAKED
jgi:hypothetical protein